MLKVIIFDVDGVLADTLPLCFEIIKKIAHEKKIKLPDDAEDFFRNKGAKELMHHFNLSKFQTMRLVNVVRKHIHRNLEKIQIFPGMKKAIKELSEEFQLGIISSSVRKFIKKLLKKHDIDIFHKRITNVSLFGKEDKIKKMLKKLKIKASEAVYVGDEIRDIIPCKKAKVRIIAVTWGYNSEKLLKRYDPEFIARTPEELLGIIRKIK